MAGLTTNITAVSVYPDRARVTRSGTAANLQPGVQRLEIGGLPLSLETESLRAAAAGTARARLLGVQVERVFFTETPAEQVRGLENQLEAVGDNLRDLAAREGLIKGQRAVIDSLAAQTETYATALAAGETDVEKQLALFDGLRRRAEELEGELASIAKERRELERQQQKLKNELDRFRGQPRREQYAAFVEVEVLQAGDLKVDLTYVVQGAGWQPLYDLRLDEKALPPTLELGYLAQVTQRSGEAWQAVSLTLSTARPALAGRLPELDPWFIAPRPVPPPQPIASMPAPRAMMSMRAAKVEETQGAAPDMELFAAAEVATAAVDTSGAAVTYRVPGTVSIPQDGAPHKVTVASVRLQPELDYVSAPKLVEAVYRRAKVRNDSPYTLLPGLAALFAGDEFIGSQRLELVAPQGEIEVFLGVDDRVKVERELKRREVDKKLIGSRRKLVFGYEIRLENLLPGPARLTVWDQAPVARHEEIKVRLEGAEPRPTEQSELNLLKWELSLAGGEKRTLRFDFSIEYPQSMELIGVP